MPRAAGAYGFPPPPVPEVDGFLRPGETLSVGELSFEIRLTDGHAPGNVTFYRPGNDGEAGHAIVGDTLFAGSIGRTDLYMGSAETLLKSIRDQLLTLPPETVVHPGHGPETTIGREAAANPFCQPGAEEGIREGGNALYITIGTLLSESGRRPLFFPFDQRQGKFLADDTYFSRSLLQQLLKRTAPHVPGLYSHVRGVQ